MWKLAGMHCDHCCCFWWPISEGFIVAEVGHGTTGRGRCLGCTMGRWEMGLKRHGWGWRRRGLPTTRHPPQSRIWTFLLAYQEQQGVVCFIFRVIVGAARGWQKKWETTGRRWAVAITVVRQRRRLGQGWLHTSPSRQLLMEEQAVVLE